MQGDTMSLSEIEVEKIAQAAQRTTASITEAMEREIVPIVVSQVSCSIFEEVICGLYYRVVLMARTLSALTDFHHFQTVRMTARSVFELFLDIRQIAADKSLAAKADAFTKVQKYYSAQKVTDLALLPRVSTRSFTCINSNMLPMRIEPPNTRNSSTSIGGIDNLGTGRLSTGQACQLPGVPRTLVSNMK